MKSVCGIETVTADTSVVYAERPHGGHNTVTLWYLDRSSASRHRRGIVKEIALYSSAAADDRSIFQAVLGRKFLSSSPEVHRGPAQHRDRATGSSVLGGHRQQ